MSLHKLATRLDAPAVAARFAAHRFSRHEVTATRAAVLVLLAVPDATAPPAVVLTERAAGLRHHAGQVSFPGGSVEPGETPVAAALREAREEVGLDPALVHVLGELPPARIAVSRFAVRSVVAWWAGDAPLVPAEAEVAAAVQVPVTHLADPDHRFTWLHPAGMTGPGFEWGDLYVWGFTAFVLDAVLAAGGWARDWDDQTTRDIPARFLPD